MDILMTYWDSSTSRSSFVSLRYGLNTQGGPAGSMEREMFMHLVVIVDDFLGAHAARSQHSWRINLLQRTIEVDWPFVIEHEKKLGPKIPWSKSDASMFKGTFVNRFWLHGAHLNLAEIQFLIEYLFLLAKSSHS